MPYLSTGILDKRRLVPTLVPADDRRVSREARLTRGPLPPALAASSFLAFSSVGGGGHVRCRASGGGVVGFAGSVPARFFSRKALSSSSSSLFCFFAACCMVVSSQIQSIWALFGKSR
jgi:hypothetical protein